MSWIKNQFNKYFKMDDTNEYEEYVEEMEPPEEQNRQRQQDVYQEPQPPKKTFRFPLMDDEYNPQQQVQQTQQPQPKPRVESQTTGYYNEDNERLSLPNHLQKRPSNEALNVEVSGIRDLLERRRKGKGHSNVIPTPEPVRKVPVSKEERQVLTKNPKREDSKTVNKEFINPLENRKRFVPTEVPSPVHGFLKPTPIEKLIEKQQHLHHLLDEEAPVNNEPVQEVTVEQPTSVEKPIANVPVAEEQEVPQLEAVPTTEPLAEMPVHKELVEEVLPQSVEPVEPQQQQAPSEPEASVVEEPITKDTVRHAEPILFEDDPAVIELEPIELEPVVAPLNTPPILLEEEQASTKPQSVEDVLNDVQVKHVTIENSTIHIGQLNVEQLPQQEQDKIMEQAQQMTPTTPEPVQPQRSGSRLPFNVLMLKSDKQKLLTKQYVAQQFEESEDAPEHHSETEETATEVVDVQVTNELIFEQAPVQVESKAEELQELVEIEKQPLQQIVMDTVIEESVELPELVEQQPTQMEMLEEIEQVTVAVEMPHVTQSAESTNAEQQAQQAQQAAIGLLEREPQEVIEVHRYDEPMVTPQAEVIEIEPIVEVAQVENDAANSVENNLVEELAQVVEEVSEIEATTTPLIVEEMLVTPVVEVEPIIEIKATPQQTQAQESEVVATIVPDPVLTPVEVEPEVVQPIEEPVKKRIPYVKPPLDFLEPPEEMVEDREWMDEQGENLVESLSYFQIQANIESIVQGPAVTQFEITVGQGTKVSKVRNLADDIKLALAAKDIRIDAPIPGKRSIGIEIPNRISRSVRLSEVTDSDSFRNSDSPLEAALGLDLTGKPVTIDLRKMPHGLIAGATGSGKSVCINSILVSLLYKSNPNELKLMLIDPKMVELAPFNHIPHLVSPVITDVKAATAALKWAVEEMERRYQLFMHSGARKIEAYNKMCDENGMHAQKLPYLLIVIDELADLMMMSPQDVEDSIVRITQKARAAGIHLIVATQRPSVDVITGLIKSNIPTRIAFSVSSQIDSRTILDSQGAERLLGRGDMLYLGNGMSAPTRIQGTFVTDEEIEEIIEFVREQGEPEYIFKQEELLKRSEAVEEQDELFEEVCRFVYEQGSASTSLLQRKYHIGYNRAARLIDMLERQGYVSEPKGSKPRDVFITEEDLAIQFGD